MHVDREAEVGRQVAADLPPRVAGVVAAHDIPVLLHIQHRRAGRMHRDVVHAVTDLGILVRDTPGAQATVDRPPRLAGVIGPERARRRDRREDSGWVFRVLDDRVQAHPASPRLPGRAGVVAAQAGQLQPGLTAVSGLEQARVLDARVNSVRIVQGRFQVPDPRELPRMRGAVVPLVRARRAVVAELVPDRIPRLAAVIRALDNLPRPPARLRCIQPVRIGRRALYVIDLPATEEWSGDIPVPARAVRAEDEATLAGSHEYPYCGHQ